MSLKQQLEGIIPKKESGSVEDGLADNLLAAAEVFGHDAVFGYSLKGKIDTGVGVHDFTLRRDPISFAKLANLLDFMKRKADAERKESERLKSKARRR